MFSEAFGYIKRFLIINVFIIGALAYLSFATNSIALTAFAIDKTLDLMSNLISIYGVGKARKPPDLDHHYGHEKFEVLSRFVLSILLIISVLQIFSSSLHRLLFERVYLRVEQIYLYSLIGVASANFLLFLIAKLGVAKTGVKTLEAESYNYLQDTLTTAIILLGIYISATGIWYLDPILGIVISFLILRIGWRIFRESYLILSDAAPIKRDEIKKIVEGFEEVKKCRDIAVRSDGFNLYLELTIEVDPNLTILEAHDLTDEIERAIKRAFRGNQFRRITIHVEPVKEISSAGD